MRYLVQRRPCVASGFQFDLLQALIRWQHIDRVAEDGMIELGIGLHIVHRHVHCHPHPAAIHRRHEIFSSRRFAAR